TVSSAGNAGTSEFRCGDHRRVPPALRFWSSHLHYGVRLARSPILRPPISRSLPFLGGDRRSRPLTPSRGASCPSATAPFCSTERSISKSCSSIILARSSNSRYLLRRPVPRAALSARALLAIALEHQVRRAPD